MMFKICICEQMVSGIEWDSIGWFGITHGHGRGESDIDMFAIVCSLEHSE